MSQHKCECLGGIYQGDFTDCEDRDCNEGSCCLPDGQCIITHECDCLNQCGSFAGPGTICFSCPIVAPLGACCLEDGTCRDVGSVCECDLACGTYQGDGTSCTSAACCGDPPACPAIVSGSPSDIGDWELLPYQSGVFVVHAATLPTGKVLLFSGTAEVGLPLESRVWDPTSGNMTTQYFDDDLFCAGHAHMADGRVLVNGGSSSPGQGITATNIFDPVTETWADAANMSYARWYPTTLTLPDGKILTFSGRATFVGPIPQLEVYDPATGAWSVLPPSADKNVPIYPSIHLMPDGQVFYTGTRWTGSQTPWTSVPPTALLDLNANSWTDVASHVIPDRSEGMAVQLSDLNEILVVGGGLGSEQFTAEIIDMSDLPPSWRQISNTAYGRRNVNTVILPDGTVLLAAGIEGWKWGPYTPSLNAELFDPATETWRTLAAMTQTRQYHSISILLPDGRVLNSGSVGGPGNNMTMEVFSPPYLFRGPRPTVSSVPGTVRYGRLFSIQSPDACNVQEVNLVRLSSITHHTNTDQRILSLSFTLVDTDTLRATAPANADVAPPGYYMLFLLNHCGVPSVAEMIKLEPLQIRQIEES